MGQRNPKSEIKHQFGMVESLETVGCLPFINWCRISLAHPQYDLQINAPFAEC